MGSDLYISIDVRGPKTPTWDPKHWSEMSEGPSCALARGIVSDVFKDVGEAVVPPGLNERHPECPWRLDEPYWIRKVDGQVFCDVVREKRWQTQGTTDEDGDPRYDARPEKEPEPKLRAYAALVASLLADGCEVRVWCWESQ